MAATILAFGIAGVALTFAQTSVIAAWGLLLWLYAAGGVIASWRRGEPGRVWRIAGLAVGLIALGAVWFALGRLVTA